MKVGLAQIDCKLGDVKGGDPLTKTVNCARFLTKGAWGLRNMPMLTRTRSGSGLLNIPAIDKYRREVMFMEQSTVKGRHKEP